MASQLLATAIGDRTWSEISVDVPGARLFTVCDLDSKRLESVKARYPSLETTTTFEEVLADPRIDAVAIATPVASHYRLAMQALMAGKHVFVEKPLAPSAEEAERLVDEAAKRRLVLAVDHTFIHTPAVRKMRDLVREGIGDSLLLRLGPRESGPLPA